MFCYVCGARADWTDRDFQISGFLLEQNLECLLSPLLLLRLDASLLCWTDQNISWVNLSRTDGAFGTDSCGLMRDTATPDVY